MKNEFELIIYTKKTSPYYQLNKDKRFPNYMIVRTGQIKLHQMMIISIYKNILMF